MRYISTLLVLAGLSTVLAAENVQTFKGSLGGAAPPVTENDASDRPFSVNGATFLNKGAALQRSCAIQHNTCASAANSGKADIEVADCDQQGKVESGQPHLSGAIYELTLTQIQRTPATPPPPPPPPASSSASALLTSATAPTRRSSSPPRATAAGPTPSPPSTNRTSTTALPTTSTSSAGSSASASRTAARPARTPPPRAPMPRPRPVGCLGRLLLMRSITPWVSLLEEVD
ncbi:hypothetical protein diail_7191 [Diaporthe ilicicola]|nr:hypothetical protein diail_7191 [Diaporthe ilicicola]